MENLRGALGEQKNQRTESIPVGYRLEEGGGSQAWRGGGWVSAAVGPRFI